jgi:hypothetical protein
LTLALIGSLALPSVVAAQTPAAARGMTFVMHVRTTPTGEGAMATSLDAMKADWTGKVISTPRRGRIDIIDATGGPGPRFFKKGDHVLFDTSGSIVVTPVEQTFASFNVDPSAVFNAVGSMATFTFKDVKVGVDSLGAGEPIAGIPTRKYRITSSATMTMSMPALAEAGITMPAMEMKSTTDYWLGVVPFPPTPFVRMSPDIKIDSTVPSAEMTLKVARAMRSLPAGMIPVKTVTTSHMTMGDMGSMRTEQIFELSDFQTADVDLDRLTLPAEFRQRALNELPMTPFSAAALEKWKARP